MTAGQPTTPSPAPTPPPTPRRGWLRWLWPVTKYTIIGMLLAEMGLRYFYGFGNPPLYATDLQIEYYQIPGKYSRFGNTITFNSKFMRGTPDAALERTSPQQVRVLVLGDSIIHGGNRTDDADLATSILGASPIRGLPARLSIEKAAPGKTPTPSTTPTVLNISCNSWGPGNVLAYLERFGTFDADYAILVLNAYDYGDVRLYPPMSPETPVDKPYGALHELARNYGPRVAPFIFGKANWGDVGYDEANPPEEYGTQSLDELRAEVELLRSHGIRVGAIYHPFKAEIEGTRTLIGKEKILATLDELGVPHRSTEEYFLPHVPIGIPLDKFYRDPIHLTSAGQRRLSVAMAEMLVQLAKTPPPPRTAEPQTPAQSASGGEAKSGSDEKP